MKSSCRCAALALLCIFNSAPAQEAVEPAANEPAERRDWRLSLNVQGDVLLNSNLPEDRQKTTELRRARAGGQILVADGVRLSASVDFSNDVRLGDLFVEVRRSPLYWAVGRLPEPFGLAAQESSRTGLMMERPLVSSLGPGYGLGGAVNLTGEQWGLTAGLFTPSGNVSEEDLLRGARQDQALTLRHTRTLLRRVDRLLHFGFSFSERKPDEEIVRFVAIPESVLVKGLQISSGLLPTTSYTLLGVELAFAQGPLIVQAEYIKAELQDLFGTGAPVYDGYYLESGWCFTGERRPYSTRRGVFGPISPSVSFGEGAHGAWELAARYSTVDFAENPFDGFDEFFGTDSGFEDSGVFTGGTGSVASLGLNWYPSAATRVSLNALRIEKERREARETAHAVQLRAYWQFDRKRE